MWKYQHQQAHDRYKAGHKAFPLTPGHTWRLASEFEANNTRALPAHGT